MISPTPLDQVSLLGNLRRGGGLLKFLPPYLRKDSEEALRVHPHAEAQGPDLRPWWAVCSGGLVFWRCPGPGAPWRLELRSVAPCRNDPEGPEPPSARGLTQTKQ